MFRRFVSGSSIASIAVAFAALVVLIVPGLDAQMFYPLAFLWCLAPLAWGLWAALAPGSWTAKRLPIWGAILGLWAGSVGAFVLNLPAHILGIPVSIIARAAGVVVMSAFYYVLWMLVGAAHRALNVSTPAPEKPLLAKAA
jgi:hypothetical protein